MTSLLHDTLTLAALLAQAIQEQARCETIACEVGSLDSELCDACRFDADALSVCQCVLKTLQRGEDVLTVVTSLIRLVSERNNERAEDG